MADKVFSYLELENQLYFSPFAYVKNSFGYPWHIIGTFEIDTENGYIYITPNHGSVTLQLKLSTYSQFIYFGETIINLFNAACNYRLVKAEVKIAYPHYRDLNLFKPILVDHINVFETYEEILKHYLAVDLPFAMIDVGNETYNVFTFEKVENE